MITRIQKLGTHLPSKLIFLTLGLGLPPLKAWCQSPVKIPGPGEGYQITKNDSSQAAPSGHEGRTELSTETAVGNTPATSGRRIVANFKLGNQIKDCPLADGTAEGEGVFSVIIDSTDAQADGSSNTTHLEVRANAKYKGQVTDDGFLRNPVNAEIDYSYSQTGRFRSANGAITTPAGSNVQQHITLPFVVAKDLNPPSFGAFSGGDPTKGHYAEAVGVGMALTYWGGVYYSVAQTKWMTGQCVQIVFDPPSNTLQPALGTETTVKAIVRTKAGEVVPAHFQGAHVFTGASNDAGTRGVGAGYISPSDGQSDVGSPLKFIYTAPSKKVKKAGFGVAASSRAGITVGQEWTTGLGTGWSGEIACETEAHGDDHHDELQTWSGHHVTRTTITVKDGVGTAAGYAEMQVMSEDRQRALRGGAITYIPDASSSQSGVADASAPATVEVTIDKATRSYAIKPGLSAMAAGKQHSVTCNKRNCQESDMPFYVAPCIPGEIVGTLDNPNHLQGSKNDTKSGLGRSHNGTSTSTLRWDLARQGSSE